MGVGDHVIPFFCARTGRWVAPVQVSPGLWVPWASLDRRLGDSPNQGWVFYRGFFRAGSGVGFLFSVDVLARRGER